MFSTLHTKSASESESIARLLDMGMDAFNFADALLGILAQRPAKKVCDCKESYVPSSQELKDFIKEFAEELRHTDAWKAIGAGESQTCATSGQSVTQWKSKSKCIALRGL